MIFFLQSKQLAIIFYQNIVTLNKESIYDILKTFSWHGINYKKMDLINFQIMNIYDCKAKRSQSTNKIQKKIGNYEIKLNSLINYR